MFGVDSSELLIIAVVALVVIGPKDLPRVMRTIGHWVGQARGMARHFRSGVDTMIREAELEDMEKKWKGDNERIMREHPMPVAEPEWAKPVADELGFDDAAPVKPKALPKPRTASARSGSRPKPPPASMTASRPAPSAAPPAPPLPPPAGGDAS
jgi:sec-independent protein translocase protein TatB